MNPLFIVSEKTAEELGIIVRKEWIAYCIETGRTDDPHKICAWEELDEWSKEVDRRIGVAAAEYWYKYATFS